MQILDDHAAMAVLTATHDLCGGQPGTMIRRAELNQSMNHDPAVIRAALDLLVSARLLCRGSTVDRFTLSSAGLTCLRSRLAIAS